MKEMRYSKDEPGQQGRCYNGWVVALATPTALKGPLARIYLEADPTENNLAALHGFVWTRSREDRAGPR
jgi:hypothetical protein